MSLAMRKAMERQLGSKEVNRYDASPVHPWELIYRLHPDLDHCIVCLPFLSTEMATY